MKPEIAVVSYNSIFPYQVGVEEINGKEVLFLPYTFTPKCPESVTADDSNFCRIIDSLDTLEMVFVFLGKTESGSLEIADLFCTTIDHSKLFFVLCDHGLEEKLALLKQHGIAETQKAVFIDWHEQCQETAILLGYLHHYINRMTHVATE